MKTDRLYKKNLLSISIIDITFVNLIPIIGFLFLQWSIGKAFLYFSCELLFLWLLAVISTYVKWKKYNLISLSYFFKQLIWVAVVFIPLLTIFALNVYFEEGGSYKQLGLFLWQLKINILILFFNSIFFYFRKWNQHKTKIDDIIEKDLAPRFMVINAFYGFNIILYHFFNNFYETHSLYIVFFIFPLSKIIAEIWGILFYKRKINTNSIRAIDII